jgi:hypothetical protein
MTATSAMPELERCGLSLVCSCRSSNNALCLFASNASTKNVMCFCLPALSGEYICLDFGRLCLVMCDMRELVNFEMAEKYKWHQHGPRQPTAQTWLQQGPNPIKAMLADPKPKTGSRRFQIAPKWPPGPKVIPERPNGTQTIPAGPKPKSGPGMRKWYQTGPRQSTAQN